MESVWVAPFSPDTREKIVDFPVAQMTLKAVRVLRDRKIDFPSRNARVKGVSHIFSWAMENEFDGVVSTPARGIAGLKPRRRDGHQS
jgi:hypothetical protein